MKKIIAIDVGGTFIKHGVINEIGELLVTSKSVTNKESFNGFMNLLYEIIESYIRTYEIDGVSISLPGFVNSKKGYPTTCGEFKFLENIDFCTMIREKFNFDVKVENDANCAALAEKFSGNAKECDDFVCITIGTGIGGAIYVNGDLVRGKNFRSGEFCYMITKDKKGYEMISENSSMTALINMYNDEKGIEKQVLGSEIFEESKSDKDVQNLINSWYENIARMINNVASILDPEKILIGGGISSREGLLDDLGKKLQEIKSWKYIGCEIEICKHQNNAGMIGAAYNFFCQS